MSHMMRRILVILMTVLMTAALAACGSSDTPAPADTAPAAEDSAEQTPEETPEQTDAPPESRVLVVVFSATGTTKGVAEKIAAIEGADLYEIKAAEEYTDADLDWHDNTSRTTLEQNDSSARPAIGSEPVSLTGYTTVYITVIPFCTSSSSSIGRSGQNLADNAGSGNWLEGRRFAGGVSEEDLRSWIEGLK